MLLCSGCKRGIRTKCLCQKLDVSFSWVVMIVSDRLVTSASRSPPELEVPSILFSWQMLGRLFWFSLVSISFCTMLKTITGHLQNFWRRTGVGWLLFEASWAHESLAHWDCLGRQSFLEVSGIYHNRIYQARKMQWPLRIMRLFAKNGTSWHSCWWKSPKLWIWCSCRVVVCYR